MVRYTATLRVFGETFSPILAERRTGISFTSRNEPGEIATVGRHKGQPLPYGSGELIYANTGPEPSVSLSQLLDAATILIPACRDASATSSVLHLDVAFEEQCNIEMSAEFLGRVAALGLPLTISCFEDPPAKS